MNLYTSFVLTYRRWHHRVTPPGWEQKDACTALTAFEASNILCLALLLLPLRGIPTWLLMAILAACGVAIYFGNRWILDAHPEPPYAKSLSDHVPGLAEFPVVYGYFLLTAGLFVACFFAAGHRTS